MNTTRLNLILLNLVILAVALVIVMMSPNPLRKGYDNRTVMLAGWVVAQVGLLVVSAFGVLAFTHRRELVWGLLFSAATVLLVGLGACLLIEW